MTAVTTVICLVVVVLVVAVVAQDKLVSLVNILATEMVAMESQLP
jgi:hypothetical protein